MPGEEEQIEIKYLSEGLCASVSLQYRNMILWGLLSVFREWSAGHAVYSMKHTVKGWLSLDQEKIVFQRGLG